MFMLKLGAGLRSGPASLLADAIDFLGDAANYALPLWVLAMALQWRARAALFKVNHAHTPAHPATPRV